MMWKLCLILVIQLYHSYGEIYVSDQDPYEDGILAVSNRVITPPVGIGNPPMHTNVFYPDDDNSTEIDVYGVYYYITGFGGFLPPLLYSDYCERVASHGYVVLGTWPLVTDDEGLNFTAEAHISNLEYLEENLPIGIRNKADFDYLALGCHSGGCGPTLDMARIEVEKYKATINLEPVSGSILGGVDFQLPSLNLGAELANMSCSVPGIDFLRYYNTWTCPKIMLEVAEVGHCGFLDNLWWERCRDWNFCAAEEEDMVAPYKQLIQGVSVALMNTYLQGTESMLDYIIDEDIVPMRLLRHETDLDCPQEEDFMLS